MGSWLETIVESSSARLLVEEEARAELWGRGVTEQQIRQLRVGLMRKLPPLPSEAGAFVEWYNKAASPEVFVFPLTTPQGVVGGLQFRNRGVKGYRDYFDGQTTDAVAFGLHAAVEEMWRTEIAWLVEGVFDFFPIQRYCGSVVPVMGDKATPGMIRLLRRLVRKVLVGLDMDATGRRGAYTFKSKHFRDFQVEIVVYPQFRAPWLDRLTKDPGEIWEARGEATVADFVKSVTHAEF